MHTLWRLDADLLEPFSLLHGPDDSLDELLNLLVQTTDICVLLGRLLIDLHRLHSAVVLGGQCVKDEIRVFVDTDKVTGLEFLVVDQTDERQEDGLSCGCLDDRRLAYSGGVEIDVCTLLSRFSRDVQIQYFDNVADQVWELPVLNQRVALWTRKSPSAASGCMKHTCCSQSYPGCP
jgi:hypothetical protein